MKTLWTLVVEKQFDMVVLAETADEALKVARRNAKEESLNCYEWDIGRPDPVRSKDQLPYGWELGALPWGGDGETTIAQYLEKLAAK